MRSLRRYAALTVVLGLGACLDNCGDKKSTGTTGAAGAGNPAGESLILTANQQGAFLPAELADPRFADESTLPMSPFHLPKGDFSRSGMEAEPNDTQNTATSIGAGLSIRGQSSKGDIDSYKFDTAGEPQLWAIEAVGKIVGNLIYYSAGGERTEGQQVDSVTMVIPNLFLTPGRHSVEVRPSFVAAGNYTLRAIPLGKPDLRMEREPNDAPSFAQPLRPGIPRVGLLLDRRDADSYSFGMREPGQVLLQVTPGPDMKLMVNVYRASGPSHTVSAVSPGERVRMDLMLPAGEYVAIVRALDKGSLTPYKIRLDQSDPFSVSADREPNNFPAEASPLPSDLVLRGSVGEYGDRDWYQLPALSQETSMRIHVLGLSKGLNPRSVIQVVDRTGDRDKYHTWPMRDSILEVRLPANAPLFVQLNGRGDYEIRLAFTPGIPPIPGKAQFTVSLPDGPQLVEAFSTLAQRKVIPVTVSNPGTQVVQAELEAMVSHSAWSVTPERQSVTVNPGAKIQVPLQLNVAPDAAAGELIQIAVRASSPAGSASATTSLYAFCGATPVNPHTWSPIPSQMLGGLNLASASLGAVPVNSDPYKLNREKLLYDGMTPSDAAWTGDKSGPDPDLLLTVDLAGDSLATVTGITLIPGISGPNEQVDRFDVLVSEDGQTYRQVMSGRLRLAPIEQAFQFPQPVRARFAQLRVRLVQPGRSNTRATLGEWKVIGAPGERLSSVNEFNLADPALGGHMIWSHPMFFAQPHAVLSEAADGVSERLDATSPNEWVIGFRNNRAAQISRLEWVQSAVAGAKLLSTVEVSVSTESPIGPWSPAGSWKIDPVAGTTTRLDLAKPAWARFVRFSTTEPQKAGEYWRIAETIRIFERPADDTYRSALAEWGHYSRAAIYERLVKAPETAKSEEVTGNGKRDDARKLESGKAYHGRVILEEDEDWYRIQVPEAHNRLRVNLQGDPAFRGVATLQDEAGKLIAAETSPGQGGITRVDAIVEGGKTYFVRLVEPPRSIAVVFDNSGSIRTFSASLFRALGRFVETVQPRREFVNLLPFHDYAPKFLLSSWSDQPYVLQGAVQRYDRMDGSSNAEFSLLKATMELGNRHGSKAILLITDAASGGYPYTGELWAALSRVAPRVFAVELQLGNGVERQQRLMQDWASVNEGHYSTFRTNQDIDMAFERTSCYLRRPVRYTLTAETRFEELPGPGSLEVVLGQEAVVENAVEIILDASGSMLQMLGNRRRMDIAKSTLAELVEKTLPPGIPFAFRAFGTREANCESDLLLKVQPLDRARVGAMVRQLTATNMAKTPIGASLRAVAEDLKAVKGRKTVVLLTDGEETCEGDPAAAIQYLKQQGLDVGVNIVGFAVEDSTLKVNFERWAELGGGRFFDAKNGQELSKALTDAMRPKFQVTDATGSVVAEGTAGGAAVDLPVGLYTVRVLTSPVRTFNRVRVDSKSRQQVVVKGASR